jgi:LPXTG-motif cell wall-anchored protein
MFDNLEPGYAYTVSVDKNQPTLVGQNFVPTVSGKGTPATDSSAAEGSVTSALLDGVNVTEDLSLDFGYVCRIRVGDYVWVDTNKDGIQNETGTGIPGVTLTLTTWDGQPVTNVYGNPVGPVTTDSNGYYLFDDLTPNTYIVHIDNSQPALSPMVPTLSHQGGNGALDSSTGSEYTGALDNTYVIQDMTLDFGFVLSGVSVGDLVWVDSNHDGVQDATEAGIPGITMTITNADGTPAKDLDGNTVTTTTTDGSGKYVFSNLVPGTYKVAVGAVPAGLVPTITGAGTPATDSSTDTATSVALNGTTTASDTTLDFGFVHLVSIGDYVWYDSNRNGVQDEGEAAVANVTVNLYDGEGQLVSSKVTDANGYYAFNDLMPSTDFVVEFVAPTNTTFTDPVMGSDRAVDSNADPVTGWALVTTPVTGLNLVDPGMADDPSIDAGLVKLVSVGDVVWLDVNRDGLQTPGEPLLQGVTVNLYDQDGVMVDSTVTDADGFYSFTDLLAGASYSLEFVKPDGSVFTTALAGTDRAIDSDAPANGMVAITAPADGMNSAVTPDDPTFDAGLVTQINLVLAKDLISSGTVAPGEVVTFALTPSNQGPMDALPGWSVTEVMPAGLELVDMSGEGYTCDVATATCVAGSGLAAGASGAVITVHAKVGAVASGSLKNVAFVAPSTEDVVETNPLGNPPTTATDTTTSTTDNDAQASVSVKTPSLPRTGSEVPQWAGLVPLLLAAGGILLLVGRRRKTTTN